MEYLTGKTEKKTLGIQDILAGEYEGKEVTVNGAVHKIRDMGDVAFVVLRKSEGHFAERIAGRRYRLCDRRCGKRGACAAWI